MKKRFVSGLLVVILSVAIILPVSAVQIIGQVLATDIRAYINGAEIPAYNIDGKLAIIVSDLNNYGFKTQYNNDLRKTSVTRNLSASSFTSVPSKATGLPIGTPVMSVYASDITVELDGRQVPAFNVDNRMAIYFTELKEYGDYGYDNTNRASVLKLSAALPVRETTPVVPVVPTTPIQPLIPEDPQWDEIPSRTFSANDLLMDIYPGFPMKDEDGREIFIVNLDTGKIHVRSCRYWREDEYDWPAALTVYPDELIASDPFYSYCLVCCKGRVH